MVIMKDFGSQGSEFKSRKGQGFFEYQFFSFFSPKN